MRLNTLAVCTLLVILFNPVSSPVFGQTNIIQIVADDMGWADLSSGQTSLGNGSPYYQTPNIDALAATGMSFNSYYAQPTCSPTRAALLTGQYAPRNGLHHVGSLNSTGSTTLLIGPDDGNSIKAEAVTIGELLQSSGYVTAHIGKFHCTNQAGDIVSDHGFDLNIGGTNSGGPSGNTPYFAQLDNNGDWVFANSHGPELDVYAEPYTQQYIDNHLAPYANDNDPATLVGTPKHLNDAMADAAIEFLEDRATDNSPFFVNVAFNAVHSEVNSRPDLEAKYLDLPPGNTPQHNDPVYAGLLEGMDQAIGRIVDCVTNSGLSGNTLIVFMSDNGGANITDNFPLSGNKGSFQEGGIRVPMIAWMPGTIPAGSISDEAIHPVDFYKTYAEFAGTPLPDEFVHPLDGESFAGILAGMQAELYRRTIYYHFPGYAGQTTPMSAAIHDAADGNRYKLIYHYEDRRFEVYDLTNDIAETVDLVAAGMTATQLDNAVAASLDLADWLAEIGAELPTVRDTGEAVSAPGHSPTIQFALGTNGLGSGLDGATDSTVGLHGISMDLSAKGIASVFDTDNDGVGVNSSEDSGGAAMQRRIDGSLPTPEAIEVRFDQDVFLKQLAFRALSDDGSEIIELRFVSGENPFEKLTGYDANGFSATDDSLTFARSDGGGNAFTLQLGRLDQSEVLIRAGTTIQITSNPAVRGGVLLEAIGVAVPFGGTSPDFVYPQQSKLLDGSISGGLLPDVFESDNLYLELDPSPTTNPSKQRIDIILLAESEIATPSSFSIRLEAAMVGGPSGDVNQEIELWDELNQTWVSIDSRAASSSDVIVDATATGNLDRFIHPSTQEILARVVWTSPSFSGSAFDWFIDLDQAVWQIQ